MSEKQHTDRRQTIETIRKLVDEIEVAMLTTKTQSDALRSRPMITASHEFDGDLWFFTMLDDPKVSEIKSHPQVNVAYASPNHDRYLSLTGAAEVVTDRKRIETLWNGAGKPGTVADRRRRGGILGRQRRPTRRVRQVALQRRRKRRQTRAPED